MCNHGSEMVQRVAADSPDIGPVRYGAALMFYLLISVTMSRSMCDDHRSPNHKSYNLLCVASKLLYATVNVV